MWLFFCLFSYKHGIISFLIIQGKKMKLNVNVMVKINLTEDGYKFYTDWLSQFPNQRVPNKNEVLNLPLWEVMQIFGTHLYNGQTKMFFEDNSLELVG